MNRQFSKKKGKGLKKDRMGKSFGKDPGPGKNLSPKAQKPRMKFSIDSSVYVPKVQEPKPVCLICGKPIDSIASAICEGEGLYSHFDCVLGKLGSEYPLNEGEKFSYLGKGVFGIVQTKDGKFSIVRKINYETPENHEGMKKFVENSKK